MIRAHVKRIGATLVVLLLLLGAAAFVRIALIAYDEHPTPPEGAAGFAIGPIFRGVSVRQEFTALGERIVEVNLAFATYARRKKGRIELRVDRLEAGGFRTLAKRSVLKRRIVDNAWHSFQFAPALSVVPGQRVALVLTSDREEGDAITWYGTSKFTPEGTQLLLNGMPLPATMAFRISYELAAGRAGSAMLRTTADRLTIFSGEMGQAMIIAGTLLTLFALLYLIIWSPKPDLHG